MSLKIFCMGNGNFVWNPCDNILIANMQYKSTQVWESRKVLHNFHHNCYRYFVNTKEYSNTSQTRGSKLAKFSNSRFLSLLFTSKLAVPLCSTQIRDSGYFLSPKNREFGGIIVYTYLDISTFSSVSPSDSMSISFTLHLFIAWAVPQAPLAICLC